MHLPLIEILKAYYPQIAQPVRLPNEFPDDFLGTSNLLSHYIVPPV